MEVFIKAVCDEVIDRTKDSIDDPESQDTLRSYISRAILVNRELLPQSNLPNSTNPTVKKGLTLKMGAKKIDMGGKGTQTVSGYNLHWTDWHKKNPQKDYVDPTAPSTKITAHQYWKVYVWDKLPKTEQDQWNQTAQNIRSKTSEKVTDEEKVVKKRAHFLFVEKMKEFMNKDEEFEVVDEKGEHKMKKTHHYLLSVWSQYFSKNKELKSEFEEIEKQINSGELENDPKKYLSKVPFMSVEKLRSQDFENIELLYS